MAQAKKSKPVQIDLVPKKKADPYALVEGQVWTGTIDQGGEIPFKRIVRLVTYDGKDYVCYNAGDDKLHTSLTSGFRLGLVRSKARRI